MKNFCKTLAALLGLAAATPSLCAAPPTTVDHPDWSRQAVIYEVNTRQYTPEGTFDAFSKELPRLKELGVDILWFMPIYPISEVNRKGTLGSYYAVRDYKGVNPEFGDIASFKSLLDKAHSMGFKVILDWVPNHTGCDNAWVAEHPEWFKKDDNGQMYGPFDWTDVYQLDYSNPEMRLAMIDALRYWVEEVGVDGFRCDVAGMVPVDFWEQARPELDKAKKEGPVFMLAEATEPELMAAAFDMDYNWPMKDLQNQIAFTRGEYRYRRPGSDKAADLPRKNALDIPILVQEQATIYPAGSYMMNMVTNHDLNSWEGTEMERYGLYLPSMTVLTYMLPGMPLIYTGQEVALDRALEFFEKDNLPELRSLAQDGSRGSRTTAMLRRLNEIKHTQPQLAAGRGDIRFLPVDDPENQLAIERTLPGTDGRVVALLNLGTVAMPYGQVANGAKTVDQFTSMGLQKPNGTLQPGEAAILIYDK